LSAVAAFLGVLTAVTFVSCQGRDGEVVRVDLGEKLKQLSDTQEAFVSVGALSKKWVVSITVREARRTTFMDFFFSTPEKVKGGSGFVVDPSGWILTNRHVVEGATSVQVTFADGRDFKGVRYKAARDTDLAFIKIDGGPFEVAPLGNSDDVRVGDWAIAIGSPFNFDQTVTVGVISAKGRKLARGTQGGYESFLQTDAAINSGNSGGPLLSLKGEVIGVNTAIFSPTRTYAGIGFAIPINRAKSLIKHLESEVQPAQAGQGAWLGVEVRELQEEEQAQLGLDGGLVVLHVSDGSPAARGGLREWDVLLGLEGHTIKNREDLVKVIGGCKPGDQVRVKLLRRGNVLQVPCRLGKRE
jgi:serine protease Do